MLTLRKLAVATLCEAAFGLARVLLRFSESRTYTFQVQPGVTEGVKVRLVVPTWARVMVKDGLDVESA